MIRPRYIIKHLASGWKDSALEAKLQACISELEETEYEYYDIKISSSSDDLIVIFKLKTL
jgi:hypothetical protein